MLLAGEGARAAIAASETPTAVAAATTPPATADPPDTPAGAAVAVAVAFPPTPPLFR